jgi:hypothetical protein
VQYALDSVISPNIRNYTQHINIRTRYRPHTSSANFSHASINLVSSMFRMSSYMLRSSSPSASVKGLPLEGLIGGVTDREGVRGFDKGLVALEVVGRAVEPFERALVRVVKGRSGTGPEAVGDDVTSGRG